MKLTHFRYKITCKSDNTIIQFQEVAKDVALTDAERLKLKNDLPLIFGMAENHVTIALKDGVGRCKCQIWMSLELGQNTRVTQFYSLCHRGTRQSVKQLQTVFISSLQEILSLYPMLDD